MNAKKKRVVILGSTGSIGESALKVARDLPSRMQIVGLAAGRSAQSLAMQAAEFRPRAVALYDTAELDLVRRRLPAGTALHSGPEGLIALATLPEADLVLISIVGTAGLAPRARRPARGQGHRGGQQGNPRHGRRGGDARGRAAEGPPSSPVDSEHNAIFQCLAGEPEGHIRRLILTASGGPFRQTPARGPQQGHARAGAQAPDLEHGPQDHHRLGHALQQGTGDDRGALALRRADGAGRRRRAPVRALSTPSSSSSTARSSRSSAIPTCASPSSTPSPTRIVCPTGSSRSNLAAVGSLTFEAPRPGTLPRPAPGPRGRHHRRHVARRAQRPPMRSPCPPSSTARFFSPPSGTHRRGR